MEEIVNKTGDCLGLMDSNWLLMQLLFQPGVKLSHRPKQQLPLPSVTPVDRRAFIAESG